MNNNQMRPSGNFVYCPNCGCPNCQFAYSEVVGQRDAKVKTRYTANLNPLHPFTFVNKKEKVVRKAKAGRTITYFQCNNCGNLFERRVN